MPNRLSIVKNHVRMSWAPSNLYNLFRLSTKAAQPEHLANSLSYKRTIKTLYQQRWSSKRLLRAYHGDWLSEKKFRRRFLPSALPVLQSNTASSMSHAKGKGRDDFTRTVMQHKEERIPLGSLMWREVEARLDVLVFRACFAHSIYEARRLVTQGHVKLNGEVVSIRELL